LIEKQDFHSSLSYLFSHLLVYFQVMLLVLLELLLLLEVLMMLEPVLLQPEQVLPVLLKLLFL
jgi:hypothetical protein